MRTIEAFSYELWGQPLAEFEVDDKCYEHHELQCASAGDKDYYSIYFCPQCQKPSLDEPIGYTVGTDIHKCKECGFTFEYERGYFL